MRLSNKVKAGIQFLDQTRPHWWAHIHLERLDMYKCDKCVLGQLYGDFIDGLERILPQSTVSRQDDWAAAHGFTLDLIKLAALEHEDYVKAKRWHWKKLQRLWRWYLIKRQNRIDIQVN